MVHYPAFEFDFNYLSGKAFELRQVESVIEELLASRAVLTDNVQAIWLIKCLTLIDLTTLSGDDTESNIIRLCIKGVFPLPKNIFQYLNGELKNKITVAAICVYPSRLDGVKTALKKLQHSTEIRIAVVAAGFPSAQYHLESRLLEIKHAIANGANEIDVVINRSLALRGEWEALYKELKEMRSACGNAHMKTILGAGELGTLEIVYKTSIVAMWAGSDFIKTSTGKEVVNATLPIGLVMMVAIADFFRKTGKKVGFKPAGGVKTISEAISWMTLAKEFLGTEWLTPDLFRFGASSLVDSIQAALKKIRQ